MGDPHGMVVTRRGNPAVVWQPRRGVTRAALAVPCPTCNVTIGQECNTGGGVQFTLPHRLRAEMAEEFGFRDTAAPGPLFARSGDEGKALDDRQPPGSGSGG